MTNVTSLRGAPGVPYVRLLGDVDVVGVADVEHDDPGARARWASTVRRGTELVAFLTEHPGASAVRVHEAMWPDTWHAGAKAATSRNNLVCRVRRWLGTAEDGTPYVPVVSSDSYRLHPDVRSDWQDFRALVGESVTTAPTPALVRALSLVRDAPLSGVKPGRYLWAGMLRDRMLSQISAAAHELAVRGLRAGEGKIARSAATVGRMIDPVDEGHWRNAMRAEAMLRHPAAVDQLMGDLRRTLDALDCGYQPEDATVQLLDQLHQSWRESA